MGGIGSGGHGAVGRKPKASALKSLQGGRDRRKAPAVPAKVVLIPAPAGVPGDVASVWNELAPFACEQRTLVPATVAAFRDLCEAIVSKRKMAEQIESDGLTYLKVTIDGSGQEHNEIKAHPLISQHRGMMQRVEAGFVRFRLAPIGKEIAPPEQPQDEFSEFDDGTVQ